MNDDTFVPRNKPIPQHTVLGIVVPIPEPWAQLLVGWRAKVGDAQANVVPPHVTLAACRNLDVEGFRPLLAEVAAGFKGDVDC